LDDLKGRLTPVGQQDRKNLLKLKEEECKSLNIPFDNEFYLWDYRYYDRLFVETTLDLDDKLVKEYFPVDVVVPVILDIYQELLGVKFFPFEGTAWHPGMYW
jgi:Zn-dependent oligopeptidase